MPEDGADRPGGRDRTERLELAEGPRQLFEAVEPVLGEFFGADGYRMGGGTVLAALWGHRHSTDVDLFAEPSQYRAVLARARLELERALLSRVPGVVAERSWVEPEAVFLDCGFGEITVSPMPRLPEGAASAGIVGSSRVPAEGIEEILGEKIRFRMLGEGSYLLRDLYDVAWAGREAPAAPGRVLAAEGPRRLRQIAAELSTLETFEGTLIRPRWSAGQREIRDEVIALCRAAAEDAALRDGARQ